ncbi:hypothetical protein IJ843_03000 [bacterium]|nr:hypothetical protein [bacterium]
MGKIIQKAVYLILALQEKFARRKRRKARTSFTNSTSKTVLNNGCSLNLTVKTEENKAKLENNVAAILKSFENMPEKMLIYIERNGTPVIRHPKAGKILDIIREEQGYIRELKGLKAFLLNLMLFRKIGFKTQAMFLMDEGQLDQYAMIHQFYKWYAMKIGMPGFDANAQENFRKYIDENSYLNMDNLDVDDIIALKEAIARDVDAITFVENIAKQNEGSQKAMKKLTDGGASV